MKGVKKMNVKEYFADIKCPSCEQDDNAVIEAEEIKWNYNYNCYARKLWCHCHHCGCDFTIDELWDCIGFDPDSINVV